MPPKKSPPAKKSPTRSFTLTRVFDAPRALVFAAWTQPKHLKQWSAPHGFTLPVATGSLKPGGKWRSCMVSERTGKLWLSGVYREIVTDRLIVFTHAWENEDGSRENETLVTVRFSDLGRKTKMVMSQTGFDSAESSAGHKGGWSECLERLRELLATLQAPRRAPQAKSKSERAIVATRVFSAPRKTVFRAFSDPSQLAQWWGPNGFTSTFETFEFRPGGLWKFVMHGPDGANYPNENHFVEVIAPERVVFDHRQTEHNFRVTMLWTEKKKKTQLTWRMVLESAADYAANKKIFAAAIEQNFDRLSALLKSAS